MFNLWQFKKYLKIMLKLAPFFILFSNQAYAWNVVFNPLAPEIAASTNSFEMLKFLSTFINWTCTIVCAYVGYKAAEKLHNSDFSGFIRTLTASFIIGSAPYFSQYFLFH